MAMTPTNEPTDRSMLRDTMISTMPVAMMATTVVWTPSVTRLGAARILPLGGDPEADPDGGQGDEHPEQAKVDLRRREQSPQSDCPPVSGVRSGAVPAMSVIGRLPFQDEETSALRRGGPRAQGAS